MIEALRPLDMMPDRFTDGRPFDPADVVKYIAEFDIATPAFDLESLVALNSGSIKSR